MVAWQRYQKAHGLHELSREVVRAHVTERVWGHDQARQQEREQALVHQLDRAVAQVRQARGTVPRVQERARGQQRGLGQGVADAMDGGVQVHLREEDRAHGYGWER